MFITPRWLAFVATLSCFATTAGAELQNGFYGGLVVEGSSVEMKITGELFARPAEELKFILPNSVSIQGHQLSQVDYGWPDTLSLQVPAFSGFDFEIGILEASGVLSGGTLGYRHKLFATPVWVGVRLTYLPFGTVSGSLGEEIALPFGQGTAGYRFDLAIDASAVAMLTAEWQVNQRLALGLGLGVEAVHGTVSGRAWVGPYSYEDESSGYGLAPAIELSAAWSVADSWSATAGARYAKYGQLSAKQKGIGTLYGNAENTTVWLMFEHQF